jgi:hypothetical protein
VISITLHKSDLINYEASTVQYKFKLKPNFVSFFPQLKGNEGAVNFFRLCFRLVSQKSLEFFTSNRAWIEKADETFGAETTKTETTKIETEIFLPGDYKSTLSLVRHVDSDTTG